MVQTKIPPIVIIAGGRATRLGGGDKLLLELDTGVNVLDKILQTLPQNSLVALNVNGDSARFSYTNLPLISDIYDDLQGPLAGIISAMLWAENMRADALITLAGDTPFLPTDLVAKLTEKDGVCFAETAGAKSHPIIAKWPVSYRPLLEDLLANNTRKMMHVLTACEATPVLFPGGASPWTDPFFNINIREDHAFARIRIKAETG